MWWLVGWLALGSACEPGGPVFGLYVLFCAATLAGHVVSRRVPPMPALLGQLVVGIALRNLPIIGPRVGGAVDEQSSAVARTAALGVILTRAGLALDLPATWRLRWPASRLAFGPSSAEALAVTLVSKPLLGLPWPYAATLGYLFAAISPAVVIPSLLHLNDRGYGREAGVAALAVTAASVDVVYTIAGFGVASSLLVGGEGAAEAAWRAPVQLLAGVLGGWLVGTVLLPGNKPGGDGDGDTSGGGDTSRSPGWLGRTALLLGLALAFLFGGAKVDATGGAALGVIVMAATAGRAWGGAATNASAGHLNGLWLRVAQPMLFALIGAAVDLSRLSAGTAGKGLLVLFVGLLVRGAVAFLAAGGGHLGGRERVFMAVAWMPKATVQAALAGIPYTAAVESFGRDSREANDAEVILALGVLAIVVAAPLGAAAVAVTGERLLTREEREEGVVGEVTLERQTNGKGRV